MQQPVRWVSADRRVVASFSEELTLLPGKLRLLDQTLLPVECRFVETDSLPEIIDAIQRLVVRGAPAIGCAAALGLAAVAQHYPHSMPEFNAKLRADAELLAVARPTAVNLAWAVKRMLAEFFAAGVDNFSAAKRQLLKSGLAILSEDIAMCRAIGRHGVKLLHDNCRVLTHCNAGALATGDYGTALAPVYCATEQGMHIKVYSDETRPLLQGSRLTAWELHQAGVEVCTICDNMAAQLMKEGRVDIVITGADRIAANGDTANKIGTYAVAVLAAYHRIPFYIAAPYSTFDRTLRDGGMIPIEERAWTEISRIGDKTVAPDGIEFYNPAFDVTPHELITGFITEKGVLNADEL